MNSCAKISGNLKGQRVNAGLSSDFAGVLIPGTPTKEATSTPSSVANQCAFVNSPGRKWVSEVWTEEERDTVMEAVTAISKLVSDVVLEVDAQHPQLDIALKVLGKIDEYKPPHEAGSLQDLVYWRFAQILCSFLRKTPGKVQ